MALTADMVAAGYRPMWIDTPDDSSKIDVAVGMTRRMVLAVLLKMLERAERDPSYGYVDMKLDLITGQDLRADDPIRGKGTIFGWIQGRALEALAGHAKWVAGIKDGQIAGLDAGERQRIVERCRKLTGTVMDKMETLRENCGGRLSFMMSQQGEGLMIVNGKVVKKEASSGGANVSDLFYGKGLAAAAAFLGDTRRLEIAKGILDKVVKDVIAGEFVSDQEQLDPKNPVTPVPGRVGHGPRMLLIGAAALMIELTKDPKWAALGRDFIAHIMANHVNAPRNNRLGEEYDMWEFVEPHGKQFLENGVRSDPGHATEFVGFSLKFLRICQDHGLLDQPDRTPHPISRRELNETLKKNFANGFSTKGYGICKAYDIAGRKPINSDMPWWNLPETIRAGMEAVSWLPIGQGQYADIVRQCSNAFMTYFVRQDRWLMANQTIDENGNVVAVVPATPDADPGYHTGLSLIDALGRYDAVARA